MPDTQTLQRFRNPFPTTDLIIEYNDGRREGIVLIERRNPPLGLALPGGFAEYGLSLEDNALKEAKEETNLEVILENPGHPLCVRSSPDRDPRAHMISIAYVGRGYGQLCAGDDAKRAHLYTFDQARQLVEKEALVFDHTEILKEYFAYRGMPYG
ncbi:MAG: NUDIX domain-containing protein [Nanoarchaeota archaeon]